MIPFEQSYGFVVVYRGGEVDQFLLVHQKFSWSFPKGHAEGIESPQVAAARELLEETGLADITVVPEIIFTEEHEFVRGDVLTLKKNTFFLATVSVLPPLRPQVGEIEECRFVTAEEALQLFEFENSKQILREAQKALAALPRG